MPAQLRRQCEGVRSFVMRKGLFESCLVVYPEPTWDEMTGILRSRLSKWNRRQDGIFRQFVSEADRFELEDNGRFLIPRKHIEELGLKEGIRFIGCCDSIEIWPAAGPDSTFEPAEGFAAEIEKIMSEKD